MSDDAAVSIVQSLAKPLDLGRVRKRVGGGGRTLSYLEGHDAIRTANAIFGYGGWSSEATDLIHLGTESFTTKDGKKGIRVAYRATVRVRVPMLDAVYADTGYGDAMEYGGSELTPHELASKEAVTDALKRCLMHLGDQFGLCLYDKDAPEHNGGQKTTAQTNTFRPPPSVTVPADAPFGSALTEPPTDGGDPAGVVLTFGKHKGKRIADAPREYLEWWVAQDPPKTTDMKRQRAAAELFLRGPQSEDEIPF